MSSPNDESLKSYLLIVPALLALFLFSWSIFHSDLSKREAREGVPVVNMMKGGNLWLPQIHSQQLRTKPPLFYWSGLFSSKVLGEVSEVSLRIPSVLAGVGTVFLTTFLGMQMFSPLIGCMAGLILATCWRFAYLSSHARIDMLFTFFITLGFVALWELSRQEKTSLKWLAGIAIGLAVLTKGPLGWLFPLLALFVFSRSNKTFYIPWFYILFVPLALAGLWLLFGMIAGGEEFSNMIYRETVGRILGSDSTIHIHPKPFYYYIPQIFGGMAPWSLFLPFALWYGIKNQETAWKFCLIAFVTLFVFLSLFPGKRGDYLIPLYPMGAILLSTFLTRGNSAGLSIPTWLVWGMMMVLGIVLAFSSLFPELNFDSISAVLNRRDRWLGQLMYDKHRPATFLLVAGAVGMFIFAFSLKHSLQKGSGLKVSRVIAVWAFILYLIVHGPAARTVNEHTSVKPFAEKLKQVAGNRPVYKYSKLREDIYYYMDGNINEVYEDTTELMERPNALLLIRKTHEPGWLEGFPKGKTLLEMDANFETYFLFEKKVSPTSR